MNLPDQPAGFSDLVNFSEPARGEGYLHMPHEDGGLHMLAGKAGALAKVVRQGKSVAVYTGQLGTVMADSDPDRMAIKSMSQAERQLYEDWKQGVDIPDLDRNNDRMPLPKNASSANRYRELVDGLNSMYERDDLTAENVSFFISRFRVLFPLLLACSRVRQARNDHGSNLADNLKLEEVEYRIVNRAIATTETALHAYNLEIERLLKNITEYKECLQARSDALKAKFEENAVSEGFQIGGQELSAADFDFDEEMLDRQEESGWSGDISVGGARGNKRQRRET